MPTSIRRISSKSRYLSFANIPLPIFHIPSCRSPIIHPRKLLCCSTFIAVMKTAELWNCDNLSHLQHLSGERTLLVEAQVGSRFVVVAEVRRQRPLEMASVQDDVVVQTLPSNRADESLGVWILPGALRCRQNLLDAQRLDSQSNFSTVPAVAIADEITGDERGR